MSMTKPPVQTQSICDQVRQRVPDVVGLSLAQAEHREMCTLMASDAAIAVLDGVQYLDGGPSVDAVTRHDAVETTAAELQEHAAWRLFASSAANHGVVSTLATPVTEHGCIVGTVTLYAATDLAFEGRREELADLLGEWAPAVVRNGHPSVTVRRLGEQAPRSLREEGLASRAVGLLAVRLGTDVVDAGDRLNEAAARAGITPAQLAEELIRLSPS